ncbi:biotin--[acetyl-CoA-carboxylase] ligase [Falsiroseomonas oryzae]|uniref:biotin--[acetyl-CoA-carboxylase] ligase n=1 Tax=Falsiroseomonas oryzae TaxID=2766473 RepID=UPI0022EAEAD6|nr:biotin--[acetyl-CoA-carboxylase] ligase [Roseomonas sp. MO-31]
MPAPSAIPPGWRLRVEESLPSTSDLLLRLAAAGEPAGLAVLARRQTAGRGRDGRAWSSPEGNLYLSVLLRPGGPARDVPHWALLAAVALAEALEPGLPDPAALRLKWPNDVLLGGAKLAGVLCESAADAAGRLDWLVMGFGANLALAPDIPGRATACLAQQGPAPATEAVAARLLQALEAWRGRLATEGPAAVVAAWVRRGPAVGTRLTLRASGGETTGLYAGLAEDGALLLDTGAGPRRFTSGETEGGGVPGPGTGGGGA